MREERQRRGQEFTARRVQHDPFVRADDIPGDLRRPIAIHKTGVRQHPRLQLHVRHSAERRLVHRHYIIAGHDVHLAAGDRRGLYQARQRSEPPPKFRDALHQHRRLYAQGNQPASADRPRARVLRVGSELQSVLSPALPQLSGHDRRCSDENRQQPKRRLSRLAIFQIIFFNLSQINYPRRRVQEKSF